MISLSLSLSLSLSIYIYIYLSIILCKLHIDVCRHNHVYTIKRLECTAVDETYTRTPVHVSSNNATYRNSTQFCVAPCHAMPYHTMPYHAMPCQVMSCHATSHHFTPHHVTPRHITASRVTLGLVTHVSTHVSMRVPVHARLRWGDLQH